MKIYIGCSRWTNPSRPMARHIEEDGQALCGKQYKAGALDVYDGKIEEVTCQKCLRLINNPKEK
jgi:hypothetical protein